MSQTEVKNPEPEDKKNQKSKKKTSSAKTKKNGKLKKRIRATKNNGIRAVAIRRLIKDVAPDKRVTKKAVRMYVELANKLTEKISTQANEFRVLVGRKTVLPDDVLGAISLCFEPAVGEHASHEVVAAIKAFRDSRNKT